MTPNAMPMTATGTTLTCPCGASVTYPAPVGETRLLAAVFHRWNQQDDGSMTCRGCKEDQ